MQLNLGKSYNRQILLVCLTLLFLCIYEVLPKKQRQLLPSPDSVTVLYSDSSEGGSSTAEWLEEGKAWRCNLATDQPAKYCGATVFFDWQDRTNVDLSSYDEVHLEIAASPSVKEMTIYMRNFQETVSVHDDIATYMFVSVALTHADLNRPLAINLREFRVAQWWIDQYRIPRQFQIPQYGNVVSIGFDVDRNSAGEYILHVKKCVFSGELVSRSTWYLSAILFWVAAVLYQAIQTAIDARKKLLNDQATIRKMTQIQQSLMNQKAEMEKKSFIDPLTQVNNRFGFEAMLQSLRDSDIAHLEGVLMVVDIDHFKRINDQRGHAVGDKVIAHIAAVLRKNVRELDSVVRWGGEEFLLCLPNCSLENATHTAEKIRRSVETATVEGEPELVVTASLGLASFTPNGDFEAAFENADKALYRAKRSGRNRVEFNRK